MGKKYVYSFGEGVSEGIGVSKSVGRRKEILGGKGNGLAEMTHLSIPVPPGFTISTDCCDAYYKSGGTWPGGLNDQVEKGIARIEQELGATFGGSDNPLLVSVRSGAAVSMPGMMDTVLNLGLTPETRDAMIRQTGNERFVWDAYRRFIQMFGDVVMGLEHEQFGHVLETVKKKVARRNKIANAAKLVGEALNRAVPDVALDVDDLKEVVKGYLAYYKKALKQDFPTDAREQLRLSINAVFGSWNNPRANRYRELNEIRGLLGTAVNVQAMVFGNMGESSGTGVCFSRDPSSGENVFYGEYLMNAQGEDVVAGVRTPEPIAQLADQMPDCYEELVAIKNRLEQHFKDMQDMEFTIQQGRLFMLQTRTGKRTIFAQLRMAVEMVKEGLIDEAEALVRVNADQLGQLFAPLLDEKWTKAAKKLAQGLNASPGGATGKVVFDAETAEAWAKRGEKVLLARMETSPEDIGGMAVSQGILTSRGGMTSHAAVVARGMGTPCVAGAGDVYIDSRTRRLSVDKTTLKQGDWISIDGFTGAVYAGEGKVVPSEIVRVMNGKMKSAKSLLHRQYARFMGWVDKTRKLKVRTNADTPIDSQVAVTMGAEGIGLCRTEHMFFAGERIVPVRQMILASEPVKQLRDQLSVAEVGENKAEIARIKKELKGPEKLYLDALKKLLPLQRRDFEGIFKAMAGRPVTIRLLDPPLHEFLPQDDKGQREVARVLKVKPAEVKAMVESLHEFNPMLGHRGCRLAISYPEIYQMQVRAIIEAALNCKKKGIKVEPEIMIPLIGTAKEFQICADSAKQVIDEVFKRRGAKVAYLIGTMIEVPRAALTADEVAASAEFFSFGTNDLTQMTCGFSRDDAGKFLGDYVRQEIYDRDPFQSLDQTGVGLLVQMGIEKGRSARGKLKVGICGEHGGDPQSVAFCHQVGMDYVSCSPYRVPVARLAAAQAALADGKGDLPADATV